jgi:hypothetical protein
MYRSRDPWAPHIEKLHHSLIISPPSPVPSFPFQPSQFNQNGFKIASKVMCQGEHNKCYILSYEKWNILTYIVQKYEIL